MGTNIKDGSVLIDELVRNMSSDFIAEVFMEELGFLLDEDLFESLIVRNHGMNSRSESKDVLYVDSDFIPVGDGFRENLVLHLSRNSLYHQLPEILFYPLALDVKTKNKKEVVDTIRRNREKEKANLDFFSLFDTEIFKERVNINNRSLNFFSDKKSKQNLLEIFKQIIGVDLLISDQAFYKLFLNLCESEFYKENLPELEKLIAVVLGLKVKISYVPHVIKQSPYLSLGDATLGVDLGLSGDFVSEIDDIKVVIQLQEGVKDFKLLEKNILLIKEILNFFIVSSRKIHVTYENNAEQFMVLSESFLGYDSYLTEIR